jgi:CheY-like chemotaxis protein
LLSKAFPDTWDMVSAVQSEPAPAPAVVAPTILVIDDDVSVQQFAARALAQAGYKVLLAADVPEALHVAAAHPTKIDLALIDIMLPSGNGVELATALLTKRRDALVLYMSGFSADAIQAVQHDGGPDGGFLEKPFSAQALIQRVQEVLPSRPPNPQQERQRERPAQNVVMSAPPLPSAANADAIYRLESPVRCPHCTETITTLKAVRLLRTQVNFTSTLPRRGRVLACPSCLCVIPAELTNF